MRKTTRSAFICLIIYLSSFKIMAVTNGSVAKNNEWLVRINLCNGALIASNFILTAAHCVADTPSNLLVIRKMDGSYISQKREIITHPDYQSWKIDGVKRHDIALIKLSSDLDTQTLPIAKNYSAEFAQISGWGKKEDQSYPKIPYTIEGLKVLPYFSDIYWEDHIETLKSDDDRQNFEASFFSGDYLAIQVEDGKSACRGDSGAPVVSEHNEIIALVAHGQNDCINQPLFFATDVVAHYSWINSHINGERDE